MTILKKSLVTFVVALLVFGYANQGVKADKSLTKEDLVAFMNEAVEYAKTHGKEKALKEFMKKDGKFIRGELYIFANDFEGMCLAHGGNPEFVGQNLMGMTDSKGVKIIEELTKIAEQGSGWFRYHWENPLTKKDEPKLSYVMKVDETWWLGAGMYEKEKI